MNATELRKELKTNPRRINMVGKEEYFKRTARGVIITHFVSEGTEDFNVIDVVGDEPTRDELTDLQQEPFDSQYKVVFFYGDDVDSCARYQGTNTVLVSWRGRFEKADLVVDCKRLFGARLKTWLRMGAKSRGMDLDAGDLYLLVDVFGSSIETLSRQLDKLALLDHAQAEHVKVLARDFQGYTMWDMVAAVAAAKPGEALDCLVALRTAGLVELQVIAALQRHYRLLARQEAGFDLANEISEAEAQRFEKLRGRLETEKLLRVLSRLTEVEWRLKRGAGYEELFVLVRQLAGGVV